MIDLKELNGRQDDAIEHVVMEFVIKQRIVIDSSIFRE